MKPATSRGGWSAMKLLFASKTLIERLWIPSDSGHARARLIPERNSEKIFCIEGGGDRRMKLSGLAKISENKKSWELIEKRAPPQSVP